jgi:hypothetical protein
MNENSATSDPSPDDDDGFSESAADGYTLPADSSVTIERFPDGVTIQIPPAGFWRGNMLFPVALIWNGCMAAFSLCLLGAIVNPAKNNDPAAFWVLPLILSVFWLVGIGLLLASINMGRRKAALAVTGGSLMVLQTGLFGSKQREWPPGDVEAVRTGPSGMTVNEKPVNELQIFDGGAAKFSLLAGRTDAELECIAAELRGALKVPSRPR